MIVRTYCKSGIIIRSRTCRYFIACYSLLRSKAFVVANSLVCTSLSSAPAQDITCRHFKKFSKHLFYNLLTKHKSGISSKKVASCFITSDLWSRFKLLCGNRWYGYTWCVSVLYLFLYQPELSTNKLMFCYICYL